MENRDNLVDLKVDGRKYNTDIMLDIEVHMIYTTCRRMNPFFHQVSGEERTLLRWADCVV
jgi:hypothetical protein